jgi:hypothetical protein
VSTGRAMIAAVTSEAPMHVKSTIDKVPTTITAETAIANENNLRQHLNSRIHQPANMRCPGQGCNRSFVSPAALTLHFESGTCPLGMTHKQLNRLIIRADTNNYITNPSRLLTGPLGSNELPAPSTIWATERSCTSIST